MWFFQIKRTGPPDGGPARFSPPGPCPRPFLSRPRAERPFVSPQRYPLTRDAGFHSQLFCANHTVSIDSCAASPHPAASWMPSRAARFCVPRSQRLRRRLFAPLTRPWAWRPRSPFVVSPSFSQLLTLGYGAGNARAASAAQVLAIQPPTPTHTFGTHCPPMAAPRPAPSALEAPQRQCPALFRVQCLVCIPLSVPPILLSAISALPACQTD